MKPIVCILLLSLLFASCNQPVSGERVFKSEVWQDSLVSFLNKVGTTNQYGDPVLANVKLYKEDSLIVLEFESQDSPYFSLFHNEVVMGRVKISNQYVSIFCDESLKSFFTRPKFRLSDEDREKYLEISNYLMENTGCEGIISYSSWNLNIYTVVSKDSLLIKERVIKGHGHKY